MFFACSHPAARFAGRISIVRILGFGRLRLRVRAGYRLVTVSVDSIRIVDIFATVAMLSSEPRCAY